MSVKFLDHTADVQFRVTAASVESLFVESAEALMSVLTPVRAEGACKGERRVKLDSVDQTALLIDFLNELLGLSQLHGEVFEGFMVEQLSDRSAVVSMKTCSVIEFGEVVKAVTYHGASIKEKDNGTWEVEIILDV